ncbi:MAG: hypothetical protein J1F42_01965 [Lachnospiraceae bacterium]|nr:hypothetical protein [Lachnospiraceae bacterium]
MIVQIVGVKKSEYKGNNGEQKVGYNIMGLKDFTSYEQGNAECQGHDVVREFTRQDFGVQPGDVVDFEYEPGFENRATLVGVRKLSVTDNPHEKDSKKEGK